MEPPHWAGTLLTSAIREHSRIGLRAMSVIARTAGGDEKR